MALVAAAAISGARPPISGAGAVPRKSAAVAAPLELWLYQRADLSQAAQVARTEQLWRRAARAGYRHVVLADAGASTAEHARSVARLRGLAASLGLQVVPEIFDQGPSGVLAQDPDLAEGFPVRSAPFVTRDGIAEPVEDKRAQLAGRPDGHDRGVVVGRDSAVTIPAHAHDARFWFRLGVTPFRCYRLDVQVRTRGFGGAPRVEVTANDGVVHLGRPFRLRASQGWSGQSLVFNSLDHREVKVSFVDPGPARGEIAFRDWSVAATGPINVLRRESSPVVIVGGAEGPDVERIQDPLLGRAPRPGAFDDSHPAPAVRTSLPDGAPLEISWEHAATAWSGEVSGCLAESASFARMKQEAQASRSAWGARAFLMGYDPIVVAGWDAGCAASGKSLGQLLADHVRRARTLLGDAAAYVWSDLFDPYQDARPAHDLMHGDLRGSWSGLLPGVRVFDRNFQRPGASIRFFAGRGYPLVIVGDGDAPPRDIRRRLEHVADVRGIEGAMYWSSRDQFASLEAFAAAARSARMTP